MLGGKNIYVVHVNNKLLACTKTNPITVFTFTHKRQARKIQENIAQTPFTIYPTISNSFVMQFDRQIHADTSHIDSATISERLLKDLTPINLSSEIVAPTTLHIDIAEMCSSYMSLTRNLNNVNAVLIKEIRQNNEHSLILQCDDEGLPYVYTDTQMILGNLEKIYGL